MKKTNLLFNMCTLVSWYEYWISIYCFLFVHSFIFLIDNYSLDFIDRLISVIPKENHKHSKTLNELKKCVLKNKLSTHQARIQPKTQCPNKI